MMMMHCHVVYYTYLYSIFFNFVNLCEAEELKCDKITSEKDLFALTQLSNIEQINENLRHILIPRVVGTSGHASVREYIISCLNKHKLTVELDKFENATAYHPNLRFTNIVASLNPNAERFLMLACHYDSLNKTGFVGATDSAVPCAMLLNLLDTMAPLLNRRNQSNKNLLSLRLVFFDGEEAFHNWSPSDSLYGARHLARIWSKIKVKTGANGMNVQYNELNRIKLLVLLDLIGTKQPAFYHYYYQNAVAYDCLVKVEKRLNRFSQLIDYTANYFNNSSTWAFIDDDHAPFLERGIDVLHLIPSPFPEVWHQTTDDRSVVHLETVENLLRILRVFIAEYLNLT